MKAVPASVCTLLCLTSVAPLAAASAAELASSRPARLRPFQHAEPAPRPQPVRIAHTAEGRRVILSETPVEHARRFATELLAVPDLPGIGALEPIIRRHCDARHLDPRLVKAVIQVESGYNHRARSNKGAMGLMQLMPDTAAELAVYHPYDVDENLRGGTAYLRQLIDAFPGHLEMAVAAYNAGPGAVERHRGVPPYPDTMDYVRRVMALYLGDASPLAAGAAEAPGAAGAAAAAGAAGHAGQPAQPRQTLAWQWHQVRRPAPHVTRGANGRLLVTTSLAGLH